MFGLIDRIPLDKRKPAIAGCLYATVMLGLFGLLCVMAYTEKEKTNSTGHLWWKETTTKAVPSDTRITYLLIGIFLIFLALLCIGIALRLLTQEGRLKRYTAILKGIEAISVQQVASITSNSVPDVYRDVEMMIGADMLPDIYVDYSRAMIVSKKYIPAESHKTVVTCPSCGANNELIVGITKQCAHCKQPLLLGT